MPVMPSQWARASATLRIHYGPGLRVYFQRRGDTIIILLCGGDKGSQARDIQTALRLADDWSE